MRMTIDELIKEMEEEYAVFLEGTGLDNQSHMEIERKNNTDCDKVCSANEMTLDILRKYKKIVQIVNNYISSGKPYISVIDEDIRKVIEDGDD